MIKIFFTILILSIFESSYCQTVNCDSIRNNYSQSLDSLVEILIKKKVPNKDLLYYCIPVSNGEYLNFIKLDYSKDNLFNEAFRKINDLWLSNCVLGKKNFLIRYLEYSQFVDGYFAEDYFINIRKIIKKNRTFFFNIYEKNKSNKTQRVELFLKEEYH